jgi:hypothetical protein
MVIQLSASWVRDLFILSFMMYAVYSAINRNNLGFIISALFLLSLRAYMVPICLFAWVIFSENERKLYLKQKIKITLLLTGILLCFFIMGTTPSSISRLKENIAPRLIQNFTGLTYGLLSGTNVPVLMGNIGDFEILGYYYIILTYIFANVIILTNIKYICKIPTIRNWFFFSYCTGFYITVLHSTTLGFVVNRITLISWLPIMITTVKIFQYRKNMGTIKSMCTSS